MNQREREIGFRLKEFREGIKYSQASFAEIIGLTRDQLASVEYGRTPLKYAVAWKIRDAFGLSIDWLWGGSMPPDVLSEDKELPHPESSKVVKNALLTTVFNKHYKLSPNNLSSRPETSQPEKIAIDKQEITHRTLMRMYIVMNVDSLLPKVPDGYTADFADKVIELMNFYISKLPKEKQSIIDARYDALVWDKMRADVAKKLPTGKGRHKKDLTIITPTGNIAAEVKSEIQKLIDRVKRKALKPGAKAELARLLGVKPPRISEWLSGEKEPGGEYTLKLLNWVESP